MLSLGIDTSNYATSLAVADSSRKEVVCALKEFLPVADGALGLRQSDAVFHHVKALPQLFARLRKEVDLDLIGTVGVSSCPRNVVGSYMPCFLSGIAAADAFAAAKGLNALQTSHQQGHLAAALFGAGCDSLLNGELLFFHLSGGTTELLLTQGYAVLKKLGGSLDLHAGQVVDRLGVRLGFPFPAGEEVSKLAASSTTKVKPKINVKGLDCHLSGLQNQYEALLDKSESPSLVCRFVLLSLAETMAQMIISARAQYGSLPVLCAGGVMASQVIRDRLEMQIDKLYYAPPYLSQDNAIGVALIAAAMGGA